MLRTLGRTRGEAGHRRHRGRDRHPRGAARRGSSTPAPSPRSAPPCGASAARRDAREPLRRALELASQCDATLLVEEVRAELQAVGVRPRTDAATGVESLTPSERRVVDLAVGGGTNRDIAQELYVTPKTVEVHLSNAYRKLGIRGRRELPAGDLTARPRGPQPQTLGCAV